MKGAREARDTAAIVRHTPNIEGFLHSWSAELNSRASRVRDLIGDAHWLSDGHHKEFLLREMLQRYLPSHLSISRGFIRRPPPESCCSRELDILVCDPQRLPPLFAEGGLQIVFPVSVVAFFEVKTSASNRSIQEALNGHFYAQLALRDCDSAYNVWRGTWFFGSKRTSVPRILTWIQNAAQKLSAQLGQFQKLNTDRLLPNCIVFSDRLVVFAGAGSQSGTLKLRAFEVGPIAAAIGLLDFFAHRTALVSGAAAPTEFDQLLQTLSIQPPTITEFPVHAREHRSS